MEPLKTHNREARPSTMEPLKTHNREARPSAASTKRRSASPAAARPSDLGRRSSRAPAACAGCGALRAECDGLRLEVNQLHGLLLRMQRRVEALEAAPRKRRSRSPRAPELAAAAEPPPPPPDARSRRRSIARPVRSSSSSSSLSSASSELAALAAPAAEPRPRAAPPLAAAPAAAAEPAPGAPRPAGAPGPLEELKAALGVPAEAFDRTVAAVREDLRGEVRARLGPGAPPRAVEAALASAASVAAICDRATALLLGPGAREPAFAARPPPRSRAAAPQRPRPAAPPAPRAEPLWRDAPPAPRAPARSGREIALGVGGPSVGGPPPAAAAARALADLSADLAADGRGAAAPPPRCFRCCVENCPDVRAADGSLWATAFCLKAGCPDPSSADAATHAGCGRRPVVRAADLAARAPDLYCSRHPSCLAGAAGDVAPMRKADHAALFSLGLAVAARDGTTRAWRGDPWASTLRDAIGGDGRPGPGAWLVEPPGGDPWKPDLDAPIADLDVPDGSALFFAEPN